MLNTTLTLVHHQFDLVVQLLDSRASRMSPNQALLTLHADHNRGQHANYYKWYFAAWLYLDDDQLDTEPCPAAVTIPNAQFEESKGRRCEG